MRFSKSLLTGAALSAILINTGSPVSAKTVKRHSTVHRAARASTSSEIELLRAEVAALKARLDSQDDAQAQSHAQVEQAQAQAQAATAQAQALQTQVAAQANAVPVQIQTALAKQPKPKPQWFDNTSVSGRMYFNISTIDQKVNGVRPIGEPNGITNGTGFNIKRFYLSVDHKFDNVFSGDITTDISNAVGRTSNGDFNVLTAPSDAQLIGRGLYVKKAYLQAKISPALTVRLGAADMPWIPYVEGIYNYRHIENTLIDRTGFGTSADWGVHVFGDLAGGLFNYQVSVVDGAGYRNVKVTKAVDVEGRIGANYKGFFAAVGGYTGKLGNKLQGTADYNTASRVNALVGYKNKQFTLGGEYFRAHDYSNNGVNYITTNIDDKAEGYSGFASFQFNPKLSAFGRYDWVKPRKDALPGLKNRYFNVGVQYSPAKIVDLALVYKREKADNGTISTSNGTIGGSTDGTYDEVGLFGQFRF
jgi:hypothetical protein